MSMAYGKRMSKEPSQIARDELDKKLWQKVLWGEEDRKPLQVRGML